MRYSIILLIIVLVLSSCAQELVETGEKDTSYLERNSSEEDGALEDHIVEEEVPELPILKDDNAFDPTMIKVGESIIGLTLKEIEVWEGTEDYPIDTLIAQFEGKVAICGKVEFIARDNEFYFEDLLVFTPDDESSKKLPISHHESPNRSMVFKNQDEAISILDISPGRVIDSSCIEIDNFTINFLPTDAINSAILVRKINE